jgi:hypothetical protein
MTTVEATEALFRAGEPPGAAASLPYGNVVRCDGNKSIDD